MMTELDQTNLALARTYTDAADKLDWELLRAVLAPDVTVKSNSSGHVSSGIEEVIEALRKWSQQPTGSVSDRHTVVANAITGDGQVVLEIELRGMAVGDPNSSDPPQEETADDPYEVALPVCHVYGLRDGKIASITTYSDRRWRPT